MSQPKTYLGLADNTAASIVMGVDRDVEHGEDLVMLGYFLVLMAPLFAPIAPPKILLPAMALVFLISVCCARLNFLLIQKRLKEAHENSSRQDLSVLRPIVEIFQQHPEQTLTEGFNPLKNRMRTLKSCLGGLLVNPFWMPIFYLLGLQFTEEKHLQLLNVAVIAVEKQTQFNTKSD
jgi:hypothetical protein